jgi:hypothetical protein
MTTRREIREGLLVLSKAEQAQNDALLLQVGRIVVTQSNIENTLALVVMMLCRATRFANAVNFYSVHGFENRLELTNFLMRKDGPRDLLDDWKEIYEGVRRHKKVRNLAAHQGITYSMSEDSTLSAVLAPPWIKLRNKKATRLSTADLKRFGDDLERIHGLLADFSRELLKTPPPNERQA